MIRPSRSPGRISLCPGPHVGREPQVGHMTSVTMWTFSFIVQLEPIFNKLSFTQASSHIRVSGTCSLASGAPSCFRAHILDLLTNFSPSGGFSHPLFLFFPRSLTNPMKADSRIKIRRTSKRRLQRLDFRVSLDFTLNGSREKGSQHGS